MAKRKPTQEQPTPIDPNTAPEPLKEAQETSVRELRDVPMEAIPTEQLPDLAKEVKETEPEPVKEARRETEAVLNKPIEAIEDAVNEVDREDRPKEVAEELPHVVGSTTVVLGRVIPLPLYTVVFGALAAVTIVEVLSAEIFPDGWLLTLWLAALSFSKAVTVMWFYMHLKDDSRIFAGAIILPIIIAVIATLFLSAVPMTGY
jgi:hypothetical protein